MQYDLSGAAPTAPDPARPGPVPGPGGGDTDGARFVRLLGVAAAAVPTFDWQHRLPGALTEPASVDGPMLSGLRSVTGMLRRADDLLGARVRSAVEDHLAVCWQLLCAQPDPAAWRRLAGVVADAAQLTGWLAFDAGEYDLAEERYRTGLQTARVAGDDRLYAYLLVHTAHLLADDGEPDDALAPVQVASRVVARDSSPATEAYLASVEADIRARLGEAGLADRALDRADEWARRIEPAREPSWLYYFDRAELLGWRAEVALRLRRPAAASVDLFERLELLGPEPVRERAFATAGLAASYAMRQQPERAVEHASRAIDLARGIGSARAVARVARARRLLGAGNAWPALDDLDQRLAAAGA
jgi:tetratricopeptide (TPR) repeat protein